MDPTNLNASDQYYILAASVGMIDNRLIALKEGDAFLVSDKFGDIKSFGETSHGIYCNGTRMISRMEMLINDRMPFMLTSYLNEENEMHIIDLTNPDILADHQQAIGKGQLQIQRKKFFWNKVYYESIKLCSYSLSPMSFKLSFVFDADFKDIFEVRGIQRTLKGKKDLPVIDNNNLLFKYTGADNIQRQSRITFSPTPTFSKDKQVDFNFTLGPRDCDDIFISIALDIDKDHPEILPTDEAYYQMITKINLSKNGSPKISSSNDYFTSWIKRSISDLFTLGTEMPTGLYPYAGIPWYSTPFGRDAIITGIQTVWLYPEMTKGILRYLATTQAKENNKEQDAEVGKIFHEQRGGEMANTGEVPFKLYYGSIDATPLFIILSGMYYDRTGDIPLIEELWKNIQLAVEWMDKYGDVDGDGFIEYERKTNSGLGNQGWKDSSDSVFHEDGSLAETPIALCEVQGYAYSAKLHAARFYSLFGNDQKAEELQRQANELKEKFHKSFWSEEKQIYVLALDGNKKQCHVRSSNAGHCLFTGIAAPEHAAKIAKTLLTSKMFSGWGVRTIATNEARYNPMSYHNGSVWPHDNSIIATGLARYGHLEECDMLLSAMFDVSEYFDSQRLPELFCGFERFSNISVTNYPVACSPQAWAAASAFLLLQSNLRLRIKAGEKTIYFFKPSLPHFLDDLTITNLPINAGKVTIEIKRVNGKIEIALLHSDEKDMEIKILDEFPGSAYFEPSTKSILERITHKS
jgi:glycogen debranching enzyme